jgi:hypothetical protein
MAYLEITIKSQEERETTEIKGGGVITERGKVNLANLGTRVFTVPGVQYDNLNDLYLQLERFAKRAFKDEPYSLTLKITKNLPRR